MMKTNMFWKTNSAIKNNNKTNFKNSKYVVFAKMPCTAKKSTLKKRYYSVTAKMWRMAKAMFVDDEDRLGKEGEGDKV